MPEVIRSWSFDYPFPPKSMVECPFCGSRKPARSLRQVNSTIKNGCDDCLTVRERKQEQERHRSENIPF